MKKIKLRLMNEKGRYPNNNFQSNDAIFISDKRTGFVYSVIKTIKEDEQYYNSETSWALVSEIKLWSSIMLSIPKDQGKFIIFPNNNIIEIDESKSDFNDPQLLDFIHQIIYNKLEGLNYIYDIRDSISEIDFNKELQYKIYSNIDCSNHILIRGLTFLIKSQILVSTNCYLFMEDALTLLYFSIEAALSIIRKSMIKSTGQTPSYIDVFTLISEKYIPDVDLNNIKDYFQALYENRILLVHPDNKYKVSGIPILEADDYYDIYGHMLEFYRDIIISNELKC